MYSKEADASGCTAGRVIQGTAMYNLLQLQYLFKEKNIGPRQNKAAFFNEALIIFFSLHVFLLYLQEKLTEVIF